MGTQTTRRATGAAQGCLAGGNEVSDIGHNKSAADDIRERAIRLETEKRERVEDLKGLYIEAASKDLTPVQIAGIKLSVRRAFLEAAKLEKQQAVLQYALSFE